jgi:hypothetical protein
LVDVRASEPESGREGRREVTFFASRSGRSSGEEKKVGLVPQTHIMALDKKNEAATVPVHRCRFVDNAPSAITALAFPPLPLPSVKRKTKSTDVNRQLQFGNLAIGHANGNIDLSEWMSSDHEPPSSQGWVVRQVRALRLKPSSLIDLVFQDTSRALPLQSRRACVYHSVPRYNPGK